MMLIASPGEQSNDDNNNHDDDDDDNDDMIKTVVPSRQRSTLKLTPWNRCANVNWFHSYTMKSSVIIPTDDTHNADDQNQFLH